MALSDLLAVAGLVDGAAVTIGARIKPAIRALVVAPRTDQAQEHVARCLAYAEQKGYEVVDFVIAEPVAAWEAAKVAMISRRVHLVLVADEEHLPADRLPRIEVVVNPDEPAAESAPPPRRRPRRIGWRALN